MLGLGGIGVGDVREGAGRGGQPMVAQVGIRAERLANHQVGSVPAGADGHQASTSTG